MLALSLLRGDDVKQMKYSKNVTLEADTIQILEEFMHRHRLNFSQCCNRIIQQWYKFRQEMRQYETSVVEQKTDEHLDELRNAKVERE